MKPALTGPTILYCRLPGLLATAARTLHPEDAASPLALADGNVVRDACARAIAAGVRPGQSLLHARRLCPLLLVLPLSGPRMRTR